MSNIPSKPMPSTSQLLKATALAIVVASILLITVVLPAEYGIDPTRVGKALGLDALHATNEAAGVVRPEAAGPAGGTEPSAVLAARAKQVFGAFPGQSFDAGAVKAQIVPFREDVISVVLPPGKGAEVKAALKSGAGIAFNWTASAPVALDMHGEHVDAKETWTTYSVEAAKQGGSGIFVAPFEGSHGWYWLNRGAEPVTVEVRVSGFQEKLYRPGHE